MDCKHFGWNDFFEAIWSSGERGNTSPARVLRQNREIWHVGGDFGEAKAEAAGKLRLAAESGGDWPAVGDWVAVETGERGGFRVCEVLPRRTKIVRKAAGKQIAEQVLAANVDTVFLVMALDGDFNPRRMERYLAQVWECGAKPVLLLNKADLCADTGSIVSEVERRTPGAAVLAISATQGQGIGDVAAYLPAGETAVLLGSSGAGKSSIVNCLLGQEEQRVGAVRAHDSRGRHTTTERQLFFLRTEAMIIDTPGLRELQLWDAGEGVRQAFGELEELSAKCRFRDCSHRGERGCAARTNLLEGDTGWWDSRPTHRARARTARRARRRTAQRCRRLQPDHRRLRGAR